jgi:integrase/recombinase XerD
MQMDKISLSIVLDKRRKKINGKFPVKLRLYYSNPRKQKLYPTIFEFSEREFSSIWETTKPRTEYKEARNKLIALESLGNKTIQQLKKFTFEAFENAFFNTSKTNHSNVFNLFDEVVNQKIALGAISTAEKYSLSKSCIQSFLEYKGLKKSELLFDSIDAKFIEGLIYYCENVKSISAATTGIYIRNLRSVYRIALKMGIANFEAYPFGKGLFHIPTSRKINKSLTEAQLKQLWHTEAANEKQAFAKDFWFFSYFSYGMNIKDLCELKHDSIHGNSFHYVRAKTKNTKKERVLKEVPLTESLNQIIARRKNQDSVFLFGVLNEKDTPQQRHDKIKNFNKLINKYFKEFAVHSGINLDLAKQLGTYHARHSFATVAVRKGTSTALISEILHDGNLKVTQNYINSFPKEVFKALSHEMEL